MKKKLKFRKPVKEETENTGDIPIPHLPENFLWMHVNSGTKIRNVMNYASKEFSKHNSVVWSGAGQGIGKVITCAEICKKQNPGLHQLSRLRYIKSKNSSVDDKDVEARFVPEIHILLSKHPIDSSEPGYQSSDDQGCFTARKSGSVTEAGEKRTSESGKNVQRASTSKLSDVETAEFAAMGLRMQSRKRNRKDPGSSKVSENKFRKTDISE